MVFLRVFEGGLFENYQPKGLLKGILRVFCHNPRTEKSHPRKRHPFIYIYIQWVKNWGSGFWDSEWILIQVGFSFYTFPPFSLFLYWICIEIGCFSEWLSYRWALPVASCLCRAFAMPTHYNYWKVFLGHSPPGECLEKLSIKSRLYNRNKSPTKARQTIWLTNTHQSIVFSVVVVCGHGESPA